MKSKLQSLKPFFNFNLRSLTDVISILMALSVLGYIIFRAIHKDIQYDEAYTYLNTGRLRNFWRIYQFRIANTHIVNSIAVAFFTALTPFNDFMIRVPNLISSAFYLAVAISLSKQYKGRFLVLGLLLFLPLMADFMAQARGYGMSMTFLLAAFFVHKNQSEFSKPLQWIVVLLLLAFYSNYVALFPAAALVLFIWVFDLKLKKPEFTKKFWSWSIGLFLLGVYGFFSVTKEGKPLYGDYEGNFFKAVPTDLIHSFNPNAVFNENIAVYSSIVFALLIIALLLKKKRLTAGFVTLLAFSVITLLSFVSQKPLPTGRVLLPFWPFIAIAIAELFSLFPLKQKALSALREILGFSFAALLMVNYFFQLDWNALEKEKAERWKRPILALQTLPQEIDPDARYYLEKDLVKSTVQNALQYETSLTFHSEKIQVLFYPSQQYALITLSEKADKKSTQITFYRDNEVLESRTCHKRQVHGNKINTLLPAGCDCLEITTNGKRYSIELN